MHKCFMLSGFWQSEWKKERMDWCHYPTSNHPRRKMTFTICGYCQLGLIFLVFWLFSSFCGQIQFGQIYLELFISVCRFEMMDKGIILFAKSLINPPLNANWHPHSFPSLNFSEKSVYMSAFYVCALCEEYLRKSQSCSAKCLVVIRISVIYMAKCQ